MRPVSKRWCAAAGALLFAVLPERDDTEREGKVSFLFSRGEILIRAIIIWLKAEKRRKQANKVIEDSRSADGSNDSTVDRVADEDHNQREDQPATSHATEE